LRRENKRESRLEETKKAISSTAQGSPPSPKTTVPRSIAAMDPLRLSAPARYAPPAMRTASSKPAVSWYGWGIRSSGLEDEGQGGEHHQRQQDGRAPQEKGDHALLLLTEEIQSANQVDEEENDCQNGQE
jgi:hypothetical protein